MVISMSSDLPHRRVHPHRLHGRALGATIGAVVGLIAAFVVHAIVSRDSTGLFAFPATLVTAVFAGLMGGLLVASIVVGGREDDRATREAEAAIRSARAGDPD
jgi:hypothetical protein